jgi:NADPH-dependent 2,4-dienoyl-CoA reductase/sulfur reductase-like enzyme
VSERYQLLAVGGGPASLSAVRSYREQGGRGSVAIVADERRVPYQRPPLSKDLLRGESGEHELPLEDEPWFSAHGVDLVSGRAVALDLERRSITLSGGRELAYAWCLLATGAEPTRLPVPGADDPAVRVLRSLDDLRDLQHRLTADAEVIVIGSGFIGCEIAASLRILGHAVTLISDEPAPNQRRLGERAAAEVGGWLRALDVRLVLGAEVTAIERRAAGLEVQAGTQRRSGDLAVMATGVAPRTELGRAAGLALCRGAIATDSAMRTSAPAVLAAGDTCAAENRAAGRRLRVEHWGDALGQGEIAGRTAAGAPAAWDEVPGFWSTIGGRTLKYAAWGDGFDQVRFEPGAGESFTTWFGRDDRLVGVLTHEADSDYERGRERIANGAPWN